MRKSQVQFWPAWLKFGPPKIFSWVLPLLDVRNCRKLSLYAISRKKYDPKSRKLWKTSSWAWFRHIGPKLGPPNILFKNLSSSVTRYHGKLSSCRISEKTNDSILIKLSDRRTDRPTDRQTDEWFYRTLSNWRRVYKIMKNVFSFHL